MACNGTTCVGRIEDDLGTIRVVFCAACRTIAVEAWDGHRKRRSWVVTYADPKTLEHARTVARNATGPVHAPRRRGAQRVRARAGATAGRTPSEPGMVCAAGSRP